MRMKRKYKIFILKKNFWQLLENMSDIKSPTKKINNFDQILGDIVVYLRPELLKWEYKDKINTENVNKKKLVEYWRLLTHVNQFYKKIKKYELYFSEFYPETDKITKFEALEHHIHAYLEDLTILKNKIIVFLHVLKKDLKKIAINKKEIDEALAQFTGKVQEVFKNVAANRDPHHHHGMKFIDGELVDAEMAHTMLQRNSPLRDQLKPEALEEFKKQKTESFKKAKANWVGRAQNNDSQISGFIDEVFKRNKEFIYKILKIKSIIQ